MLAHDNAWQLFDYLATNPVKTGEKISHYSWVRDRDELLLWPNRVYRLKPHLPQKVIDTIAERIISGEYPREIQLRLLPAQESNLNAFLKKGFTILREFPALSVSTQVSSRQFSFPHDWQVEVKPVSIPEDLTAWSALLGNGFWKDKPDVSLPLQTLYQSICFDNPLLKLFLCYVNGIPVATSMAFAGKEAGGIYLVYVLDAYRKHSLGALVTQTAMQWCFTQGLQTVILQATPLGEPVYKRLGFRHDLSYLLLSPQPSYDNLTLAMRNT